MLSILIAEGSKLFRNILEQEFSKNNFFNLIIASDYASVKEVLEEKYQIFAAIAGTVLPDAPSGEVIDLLLKNDVPTIVLTGNISDEVVHKYSQKSIVDYVPKSSIHDILYTVEMIEILYYFQDRKALIVDDSQSFTYYMSILFKNLKLDSVIASSGEEAMEILAKDESIQIVTIDYSMPGMDGIQLVQNINAKYDKRGLSLLAVTANNESTVVSKFIKSGADDLLYKPVTKESFNAAIFKILSFKKRALEIDSYLETMEKYVLTSSTDERGIIRKSSQSFCELSGYSKEELIGHSHNIVRHPDMPEELFSDLWATLNQGEIWEGEIKNKKKDGGFYWVKAHISPMYNSNNKLIGYQSVRQDITDKKDVEEKSRQLEEAKKKITDSIEFSSLIQRAFLPEDSEIRRFYKDFFIHWEPKDIVGGDIYQFLVDEDSSLLFIIDCTGHGVPGAFMTMVVKTTLENIVNKENFDNPAKILQKLSHTIKSILKQHDEDSKSDAGLDGGVFFYNKSQNIVRYAGAKTPLFYIIDGELKVFKSDRESVGYKKSNTEYAFKNFELHIDRPSYFYITTDGYIDQNGGEGGFPYGKKKFQSTISESYSLPFDEQLEILVEKLNVYQSNHERDDDITMSGFLIEPHDLNKNNDTFTKESENLLFEQDFIDYTPDLMSNLEEEIRAYIDDKHPLFSKLEKVLTVLYEMGQNIVKYAPELEGIKDKPKWIVSLSAGTTSDGLFIRSRNPVNHAHKERIASRIEYINNMDRGEVKLYYRELRRSGKYMHEKGAGLGFCELAKRSDKPLEYSFENIDDTFDYYTLTVNF